MKNVRVVTLPPTLCLSHLLNRVRLFIFLIRTWVVSSFMTSLRGPGRVVTGPGDTRRERGLQPGLGNLQEGQSKQKEEQSQDQKAKTDATFKWRRVNIEQILQNSSPNVASSLKLFLMHTPLYFMCASVCACVRACVCTSVDILAYVYPCICACVCICTCVGTHACVDRCVSLHVCVCMCVHMGICA